MRQKNTNEGNGWEPLGTEKKLIGWKQGWTNKRDRRFGGGIRLERSTRKQEGNRASGTT